MDPGSRQATGRGGWLTIDPPENAPIEMLRAWIVESYRAVAPKRSRPRLDE